MKVDYQEYLMEIGAPSKIVNQAALIETFKKMKIDKKMIIVSPDGTLYAGHDNGTIRVSVVDDCVVIENVTEHYSPIISLIDVSYLNEYGIEEKRGLFHGPDKSNGWDSHNYEKAPRLPKTKIEMHAGFRERKAAIVYDTKDDKGVEYIDGEVSYIPDTHVKYPVEETTWIAKKLNYDYSCFLNGVSNYPINYWVDIEDERIMNFAKTVIDYPITAPYYIKEGYVEKEKFDETLKLGISKMIEHLEKWKIGATISDVPDEDTLPYCFSDMNVDFKKAKENKEYKDSIIDERIIELKEIYRKLELGIQLEDKTKGYTEEEAKLRRAKFQIGQARLYRDFMIPMLEKESRRIRELAYGYARCLHKAAENTLLYKFSPETFRGAFSEGIHDNDEQAFSILDDKGDAIYYEYFKYDYNRTKTVSSELLELLKLVKIEKKKIKDANWVINKVAELFAKASSKKYTGKMNKAYLNSIMRREFNGEIELEEANKKAAM